MFDPTLSPGLVHTRDSLSGKWVLVWNRWYGWAASNLPTFDKELKQLIKKVLAKLEADEASKSEEEEERPERKTPEEMRERLAKQLRHKVARLAERIRDHLRNVWFKGNQALFEYRDCVAWMLQRPSKPTIGPPRSFG